MAVDSTGGGKPLVGDPDDLDRVIAWAGRLAMQLDESVGLRELLLGLAKAEPRLVVNVASQQGVDPRRLAWAVSEWWPSEELPGPGTEPALLTRAVRGALARARAAPAVGQSTREALAAELLRSAAEVSATAPMPVPNDAPPDTTHAVLRGLRLI